MALHPDNDETLAMDPPGSSPARPTPAPDAHRFAPGTLVARRYRIISRLGKGGMGEVFRADDIMLGQPVALKFLPDDARFNTNLLARFYDEVRIARQISHANVCRVYDIGEIEGQPYLSMEYIDGEDLASLLRRIGRLPGDKAAEFARKMCAGLAAAHAQGVLHRDIKPGNIMIDGRGEPRITDFGLAAVATGIEGHEIRNGTPAYMAPEQLEGREVSVQSDLYALGLVFHEMFTGKPAHQADTVAQLTQLRRDSSITNPSSLIPDLDPAVQRAIQACLHPDPKQRPKSALDLARMLPGGDPLAAALAAGQTPSPEMVAASGSTGALSPRAAFSILAGIVLTLVFGLFLVERMTFTNKLPLAEHPPEVLTDRAREIARQLGYEENPRDWAIGLNRDESMIQYLRGTFKTRAEWEAAVPKSPTYVTFWYRSSPGALFAQGMNASGRVSEEDPPLSLPGMTLVSTDLTGRLRRFRAIPPRTADAGNSRESTDWRKVFELAKLDYDAFQPAEPVWTALTANDARFAWTGKYPTQYDKPVDIPIRVEAASFQGKPVYFEVLGPWDSPAKPSAKPTQAALWLGRVLFLLASLVIVGALVLGWHNWRTGRGDRTGAARVGLLIGIFSLLSAILQQHQDSVDTIVNQLPQSLARTLLSGVLFWGAYLALEPWVRRYWPKVLVTWTRVLHGDLKNPQVGRDALIGTGLAVFFITIVSVLQFYVVGIGDNGPDGYYLANLLGANYALGVFSSYLAASITTFTAVMVISLVLRVILRKEWLVTLALILMLTVSQSSQNAQPNWALIVLNFGVFAVIIMALMRFGFFAGVVMLFVINMLGDGLMTSNLSAWYGTSTWIALAITIAIAIWGYRVSVAGQSLLDAGISADGETLR